MLARSKLGTGRLRWVGALATAVTGALVLSTPATQAAGSHPVVDGLDGPRGVAVGPGQRVVFTENDGTVSMLRTKGRRAGQVSELGQVPAQYIAPAVAMNGLGETFVLTAGGPTGGILYRWNPGKGMTEMANISAYQQGDPDPYDLEEFPTDTNPFGVAALPDGSALVSDAAGNDLLHVAPNGDITTVARIKPRVVPVPADLQTEFSLPPQMPSEGVATSVAVGADGYYYVGELRGFPGTPGYSQIWRIAPGSVNAVCDPDAPNTGACRRYADGFTSIVDLEGGPDGSLYVVELDKASWLALETGSPTIGSLIHLATDGSRTELAPGDLFLPGGVGVGKQGQVYASTPVFGPGLILSVP